MFQNINQNLGTIKERSKHILTFPYSEEVIAITKLQASCDCTMPTDDKANRQIRMEFQGKDVPQHLRLNPGHYETTKKVFATYRTLMAPDVDQIQLMTITAKIVV